MRNLFLIILFFICCCYTSVAQHPYYYNINDDVGLPSNEVYQLAQDDFGYMWIGCDAGLFRYDGFKFQQFKNKLQNAVAISSLRLAGSDKLFCQNFFGQIFYTQNDSLVLFADVKALIRSHPEYTIDNDDNVWIGLPDGILKYNADGSKEHLFKNEVSVNEIEMSAKGDIYVVDAKRGVLRITNAKSGNYILTDVADKDNVTRYGTNTIKKYRGRLFLMSANNMCYCNYISEITSNGISVIKKVESNALAEFIYTITLIDNKFWLGTSNGAYCMSLTGDIESHYFKNEKISDIYVDRENTYWFSSLQNGIFVIPNMALMVLNTGNSSLKDNNITALRSIPGNGMLTGTYTGDIYQFSAAAKTVELLPKSRNAVYRNVTSIISYNASTIIAGRGGLSVIDVRNKSVADYPSVYIRDMAMVGDSIICASTQNITAVRNVSKLISKKNYSTHILRNISGKKVGYDEQGKKLWVTLNEGLASLEGDEFKLFSINNKPVFCNALYTDSVGLWVGTVSDGVYNISNGKVALHLDNDKGLVGNNIKCITSQNGTLYVATDECINIRNPDGAFEYINHGDGINAKEINAISVNDSLIYIGTIRGLFYMSVNTPFRNFVKPNIRISSVYTDGEKQDQAKVIRLGHNNKDILINFSATSLRSRGRFNYLYRIRGFQDEWKKLDGSINNVRLNHLPAGHFVFEVKAVNEDGVQSQNVAGFSLVVNAPFWEQWWFYIFVALMASALVTLLFLQRIRTIKRRADIRDQVTNSQLTALKAQMNPHFMYNTLNSIQDLVLQNDIKNTNYYLSRYSSLMRKILDTSEHKEIELAEESEILQLYLELEQLRFGSDFTFFISIPSHIDKSAIQLPSMIIQPFVENAIKHGLLHKKGRKQLNIAFTAEGGILKCNITDNGIGRVKATEIQQRSPLPHKSFATRATQKRLELININRKNKVQLHINDLYENGAATGTEVRIEIPLS